MNTPEPQSCKLGCKESCAAKEHGCVSECPALPWQPQAPTDETQAQAGEPEVVAWVDEFGNVYPKAAKRGPSWINEHQHNWKEVITLQSHREAMAKLEKFATEQAEIVAKMGREKYPFVHLRIDASVAEKESAIRAKMIELGWEPKEIVAKKDAALKACVEALEYYAERGNWRPSPDSKSCEIRDGEAWTTAEAAITQAQEALK